MNNCVQRLYSVRIRCTVDCIIVCVKFHVTFFQYCDIEIEKTNLMNNRLRLFTRNCIFTNVTTKDEDPLPSIRCLFYFGLLA